VLTVHNFTYGLLTPGLAFLMSSLGAFLGLRCTARARTFQGRGRTRWLLFGGVSIGAIGIWTMHFIAMLGFTIPGETIRYNVPITLLSLVVAVGIVCVGLLIVGSGELRFGSLLLGGLITGLGVAVMHYMGMAAMRMPGKITYDPTIFIASLVIAVVAATAALWAALRLDGLATTLGAAVIMGVAVSGMHYAGMAAMRMYSSPGSAGMVMGGGGGSSAESFLLPLIIGITVVSFIMTAGITLSPDADEMRYDAALMRHIESTARGGEAGRPAIESSQAMLGSPVMEGGPATDRGRVINRGRTAERSKNTGSRARGRPDTDGLPGSQTYQGYPAQEYPG
jgi:NO-binding membrane sensor protein with MHYT domain